MAKLIIFPTPLDSHCELILDNGVKLVGVPDVHSSGRPGQSFDIPMNAPNGNGCQLHITKELMVPLLQRGILYLNDTPLIVADDFHLTLEKVCPPPVPVPPIPPVPPIATDPLGIINEVYATGKYNLITKESCGQFTEECCKQLHNRNSPMWGHIKKSGAQNQYNGHAVDAIMLLTDTLSTGAGIYDIITNSESASAKPAFNFAGPTIVSLWYYPA